MKYFIYGVIVIVIVTVIAGFFIVGSPATERLRKYDEQRVNALQSIQWQVVNYWQNKQQLPEDLSALNDDISGFRVPADPQGGASYEYQEKGDTDFSLCAVFSFDNTNTNGTVAFPMYAPMPASKSGGYQPDSWAHGVGRVCFDRHIDKDMYPPRAPVLK